MTHEELVEKVARAMDPDAFAEHNGSLWFPERKDLCIEDARAAIAEVAEALKVPTAQMLRAAEDYGDRSRGSLPAIMGKALADVALQGHAAMISVSPLYPDE